MKMISANLARPNRAIDVLRLTASAIGIATSLGLVACGGGGDDSPSGTSDPLSVSTAQGVVEGAQSGSVITFLGIPYAAPPVGDLRWRAPASAPAHTSPLSAKTYPNTCTASEDCLYLNIYKPAATTAASKLPVMMWIHGGGLGAGTANFFDGSTLATQNNVIVVTINYRLGALGFFAHPALTAEAGTSGNYGMLDQQAAMKWIRANISGFGGDSSNLTIFGQSAGGLSVYTQLASPLAAGLFDKAVSFSGAYQVVEPTLATAETLGQGNAITWGCTGTTSATVAACLRALPAATARTATGTVNGVPSAVIDGKLLTESTTDAFLGGRFNKVPTIVGSTKNETDSLAKSFAASPLTASNWAATASALIKVATADELSANYDITTYSVPTKALVDAYGDYRFFCGAMSESQRISKWVAQSWAYEFAVQNPAQKIPDSTTNPYEGAPLAFYGPWGDFHSSDTAYWFGQFQDSDQTPANLTLSAAMRGYLSNFARNGDPNGNGLPIWKPAAQNAGKTMSLASPLIQDVDSAANHHCAFWSTKPPSASLI